MRHQCSKMNFRRSGNGSRSNAVKNAHRSVAVSPVLRGILNTLHHEYKPLFLPCLQLETQCLVVVMLREPKTIQTARQNLRRRQCADAAVRDAAKDVISERRKSTGKERSKPRCCTRPPD